VVSDDDEEDNVPFTSGKNNLLADAAGHIRCEPEEPTYRVAWDSSQSRVKNKRLQQKTIPPSSINTKVQELKEQGNAAYKTKHNATALDFYQRALQHCSSDNDSLVYLQAVLHSNIAAVYLRLNRPSDAISAAKHAHAICPDWTRPLHRMAEAYLLSGNYIKAVHACQRGEILCHNSRNSEGHTEFTPVLDRISLQAAASNGTHRSIAASSAVGFTGRQLEVRSAGDEAWMGRPAPHILELDGPLNEDSALPSDDLSLCIPTMFGRDESSDPKSEALPSLNRTDSAISNAISTNNDRINGISARADSLGTFHGQNNNNRNRQKLNRTSFRCIEEAISAASDGDRILLLKGVHNGMGQSVNINKRVLIEGQGELGETVIDQRANCPTFRITRGGVVIRNLDIDHTGFREALLIEGRSSVAPLIENCTLKCSGDDVVNTAGTAAPFFRRCAITAKKCGIRAFEKSHVRLESCIIEKCGEQGLKAMENSKIDATLCTLRDCEEDGVVIMDTANVSLLASIIHGNKGPGVDCSGQGKLELRGGEISKNDGGGIFLWDASVANLDGARIDGGRCPVILTDKNGRVNATSCVMKGMVHASDDAWQGIVQVGKGDGDGRSKSVENLLKNKLVDPDGPTDLPDEEGPFKFIPNKYTRKQ